MQEPNFLVEASDGRLHGYVRPDLLQVDLAINRDDPPRRLFRLNHASLTTTYDPIELNEFLPAIPTHAPTTPEEILSPNEPLQLKA